jgi:hypothetical protein
MNKDQLLRFLLKNFLFTLSAIFITLTTVTTTRADTLTVCASGCDYTTITDAINAAASGDIIVIGPGTYTQCNIGFTNPPTLQGAGASSSLRRGLLAG